MGTSRAIAVLCVLAACEEGAVPVAVSLPEVAAPPPGNHALTLDIDGALEFGNTLTFTVTGLARGQKVHIAVGREHVVAAYCPPLFQGLCADLTQPVVIGTAHADAHGVARFTKVVPTLGWDRWWFQALTAKPFAATSNVAGRYHLMPRGSFLPVVFQRLHLADDVLSGDVLEAGAWADKRHYPDRPWACYVHTPLVAAPSVATTPCPGCEYTWKVELDEPFVEEEIEADCASYFGRDASFFDQRFPGTALSNGGWAGFAGGAEFGVDLDYHDVAYGTIYPVTMVYDTRSQGWWRLGPLTRIRHTAYDELVVGLGYGGSFTY